MNARVPFLRWKPLRFGLALLVIVIAVGVVIGLYNYPIKTILFVMIVIIAMNVAGKLNKAADELEEARKRRNRPVGLDKVLSFSLEKEMREEKNICPRGLSACGDAQAGKPTG